MISDDDGIFEVRYSKPAVSESDLNDLLCEINEQEKRQNIAFCKWVDNDVELKTLSPSAKILLRDYVRGLNLEIADLKSALMRNSTQPRNKKLKHK